MSSHSVCRLQWLMPWAATSKEVEDGHHTGDKKADPDVEDGLDGHEPTKKEQRKRSHPKVMHLLLWGILGGGPWSITSWVAAQSSCRRVLPGLNFP